MDTYNRQYQYCDICKRKTVQIVEDGVATCESCDTVIQDEEMDL